MTNWKNTYNSYITAVKKSLYCDRRYDNLKKKYDRIVEEAENIELAVFGTLSTDHIKFTDNGITFFFNNKNVWNASSSLWNIKVAIKKDIETVKNVINSTLTSEVGCYAMNHATKPHVYLNNWSTSDTSDIVTLDTITTLVSEAQQIISNINESFMEKIKAATIESDKLWKQAGAYQKAKEHRANAPRELKWQTIRDWWNECGLQKGTRLIVLNSFGKYSYMGVVENIKEGKNSTLVYFTNGRKTHLENISREDSFNENNRRTDGTWGSIFEESYVAALA